jgi:hypothetical protein
LRVFGSLAAGAGRIASVAISLKYSIAEQSGNSYQAYHLFEARLVRGLKKVQMEMLWACLTYNLQHWIRLSKLRTTTVVT